MGDAVNLLWRQQNCCLMTLLYLAPDWSTVKVFYARKLFAWCDDCTKTSSTIPSSSMSGYALTLSTLQSRL